MSANLLTSGQAARQLGISKRTLRRAMQRGEILPASRSPGGWARFRAGDLEDYTRRLASSRSQECVSPTGRRRTGPSRAVEQQLAARYRLIAEITSDYAYSFTVRPDGTRVFEWISDSFFQTTGYSLDDWRTRRVEKSLVYTEDLPVAAERARMLLTGQPSVADYRIVTKLGEVRWVHDHARPQWDDAQGRVVRIVGVSSDITERRRAEDALRHQATHDSLTNLPNRVLLHERIAHALAVARDIGQPISLLLLDLDHFKEVNDTLGHHVGDLLLRQVATRLQQAIGATETIARLGGDEFAIILPAADAAAATVVARLVMATLEMPFQVEQHLLDLDGSIGIAVFPDHGADAPALLQHADVAMYVAKRTHNDVAVYEPVRDQHSVRRLALMHDLRRALREEGLHVYYQPKVTLATGRVFGVEALLRWSHPVHGFIPPAEFVPLAEQTGMIVSLTEWVLLTALRQARTWLDAGQPIPIAINLSARSLHDHQFADLVARHARRFDIAPADLTLEITESSLMSDPARARELLTTLHALGFRLAIDDFGTGYSSLGYLKELPVDEVKIDKSFVLGMGLGDRKDAAIVRAVVAMAHEMGMMVVAEGVEDAATYALLNGLGCDTVQGYFLSRPCPATQFEGWLAQYHREQGALGTARR